MDIESLRKFFQSSDFPLWKIETTTYFHWNCAKKCLPTQTDNYLVTIAIDNNPHNNYVSVRKFDKEEQNWFCNVVAWMELPSAYQNPS